MDQRLAIEENASNTIHLPTKSWLAGLVMGLGALLSFAAAFSFSFNRADFLFLLLLSALIALVGGGIWRALVRRRSLGRAVGVGVLVVLLAHVLIPFVFVFSMFSSEASEVSGASNTFSLGVAMLFEAGLPLLVVTLPIGALLGGIAHVLGGRRGSTAL